MFYLFENILIIFIYSIVWLKDKKLLFIIKIMSIWNEGFIMIYVEVVVIIVL